MTDRYTKIVLTVIATALVYLCIVFTPIPSVFAQANRARPGEPTGPGEMIIVGWKVPPEEPLPVSIAQIVKVSGSVTTERSTGRADRVLIAGWEEQSTVDRPGSYRSFSPLQPQSQAMPVTALPR